MPLLPVRLLRAAAIAGTTLLISAAGTARAALPGLGGPKETIGPFELTEHESSHWVGAWETKTKTLTYSIRYRGEKVRIGEETRFNCVVSFPSATPALLVNAGYPYGKSRYHLLREEAGVLRIDDVGPVAIPGDTEDWAPVEWLDQQPSAQREERPSAILGRKRMSGGRYLVAGLYAVLDTQTLAIHRLPVPPEHPYWSQIVARSPDGRSIVRVAPGGEPPIAAYLVVQEFAAGHSYALPIDTRRMRYAAFDEVLQAQWIDHHFEWKSRKGSAPRLVERTSFRPLPIRGSLSPANDGDEYVIEGAAEQFGERFLRFVEQRFGGRRLKPGDPQAARLDGGETNDEWLYVAIGDNTLAIQSVDGRFAVWKHRGPDAGLVARVSAAFEKELNRGSRP